ncbi:chromate resistance protein ChrB domain-containing protein [Chitinophaga sp.]|nr:chromate resistance protein ChrB domain-containing protein [Chitinophaga sp.]
MTRERPKIDRLACPWLIKRFVDFDAQFMYQMLKLLLKSVL